MKRMDVFLSEHRLRASDVDMDNLVEVFTEDMISGLEGKEGALRMIPTYIEALRNLLTIPPNRVAKANIYEILLGRAFYSKAPSFLPFICKIQSLKLTTPG
jgi:hypothetical protein